MKLRFEGLSLASVGLALAPNWRNFLFGEELVVQRFVLKVADGAVLEIVGQRDEMIALAKHCNLNLKDCSVSFPHLVENLKMVPVSNRASRLANELQQSFYSWKSKDILKANVFVIE